MASHWADFRRGRNPASFSFVSITGVILAQILRFGKFSPPFLNGRRLVKSKCLDYRHNMLFNKHLVFGVLLACSAQGLMADTIQLKDKSAITGKILAEKSDSIVVDVG